MGKKSLKFADNGVTPMNTIKIASFLCLTTLMTGCTGIPEGLKPVTGFDLDRYLGRWYEIARLDHRFERNLSDVRAVYTRGENNTIQIINRGFNVKTRTWKQVEGRARFRSSDDIGSLKISFFGPFYGGYHIIALDRSEYNYAMVSGPS